LKIAIVHEWFVNYAGSERVVESFVNIFPDADVFALVDFLNEEQRNQILKGKYAKTSFIQKLPLARKHHRNYLPFFPKAIESLNLSKYDLILSSSHAVTKGLRKYDKQLHISYCHSPMRYIWDEAESYFAASNINKGVKRLIANQILNYLRKWDLKTSQLPDYLIANSNYIAEKIMRIYSRNAEVIYPPVDIELFPLEEIKEDYYLTASRLVPYKKVDLIVEAFAQMPDKKLLVIGSGPEKEKIKSKLSPNIEFLGYQDFESLKKYMQKAKAFVFAAEEDFGIIVVEAMACGTPVIALNKGGTAETVIDKQTGIHFQNQSVDELKKAVMKFEDINQKFNPKIISEYAKKFSRTIFEEKIKNFVNKKTEDFLNKAK
jgi:glycosyltransferase involved in cell wall biosynthesis